MIFPLCGYRCNGVVELPQTETGNSAIQNGAAGLVQKLDDLLHLVALDTNFMQSCAKIVEERREVGFIHTHFSRPAVGSVNVIAGVNGLSAEKHGKEHALPHAQMVHASTCKERLEPLIGENPVVKRFHGSIDGEPPADVVE